MYWFTNEYLYCYLLGSLSGIHGGAWHDHGLMREIMHFGLGSG
jgi:hypothetical protein